MGRVLPYLVLPALLAGCLGAADEAGDDAAGWPVLSVAMRDDAYDPPVVRVPLGARVTWTNFDPYGHTVTPFDARQWGSPGSGDDSADWLREGDEWSFTFREAGTFEYACVPHATREEDGRWRGMVGTVVVS